jgi:hypothetical protein
MKTFFASLAVVLISVSTLYAGAPLPDGQLPEPSSLVLLLSGVGGVALWLRKRR